MESGPTNVLTSNMGGKHTYTHPGKSRLSKLEGAQQSLLDEEIFLKQELTIFYVCSFWEIFPQIH